MLPQAVGEVPQERSRLPSPNHLFSKEQKGCAGIKIDQKAAPLNK